MVKKVKAGTIRNTKSVSGKGGVPKQKAGTTMNTKKYSKGGKTKC